MEETDQERLNRLREAGQSISDAASSLKEVADQLRADVDELAQRITVVEEGNALVADELVQSDELVQKQQGRQDGRLDTLENGHSH